MHFWPPNKKLASKSFEVESNNCKNYTTLKGKNIQHNGVSKRNFGSLIVKKNDRFTKVLEVKVVFLWGGGTVYIEEALSQGMSTQNPKFLSNVN